VNRPVVGSTAVTTWAVPQEAFGGAKLDTLPKFCLYCEVRFACNGGCPKDRFATTPDGEPGLHHVCAGYKAFFGHVDAPMRFLAGRLRAGEGATALRGWYAAADAQRGRSDPCSCGSGHKFKRCHGEPLPRRAGEHSRRYGDLNASRTGSAPAAQPTSPGAGGCRAARATSNGSGVGVGFRGVAHESTLPLPEETPWP
jgi:hypothetical protein